MTKRFDRLLSLAQKTGNPLIVHDRSEKRDMVVLSVDEYEMMLDTQEFAGEEPLRDVRELSEGEMLDKINRDIAIWRSAQELDGAEDRGEMLAEEWRQSAVEATANRGRHQAGEVIRKTYPAESPDAAIRYEPAGEESLTGPQPIPEAAAESAAIGGGEPLEGDPIFFEEPVE
ncbi:MAG: hypothetical protein UY92_C0009G0021 [Candidatus Magasanikbacteria bacterium GW2011_GWA2_56_11]|uniref:Antitoxin n=1 Tax=Candidatus Magasanikbacteria bacterium GW2011_GWA2_56_11 TaxID=1619044 RepID=A0A0G2ALN6_9BACT|nr:MAG: hypothetical protein UY92_C0009G0021 [Candidatus Magasanikbacteria bacterium GW2011_GWA2_56_11]